ncbi:MAG: toll/interleukin-1 receptor domain-containing protein [Saprospiraceae bacterium]|nr:toll/interleukin-1 receptor domain-containing protein [Saprospiraceae bacterium]
MALIPGYEFDIFISYAHIDNAKFPGQTDGWIELFYKNLDLMLAKRFGRMDKIKFWWDNKKLDGSVMFNQSIESSIHKSAIMICLYSPGYVASGYCKQEIDTFYRKAQSDNIGLKVGDRTRILNVLLNNIPYNEWTPELKGTTGFPFYNAQDAMDFGETVDAATPEFRIQMQKLRDAVWIILNEFQKEQTSVSNIPVTKVGENKEAFTIYLGDVADSLRTPRKRVMTELEKKGYQIVTGIPPPEEATLHEKATNYALKKADLTVHLLDEYPGREIIGTPDICYPQKQVELALQSGKPQMVWVPSETKFDNIEDDKYKIFLQNLETSKTPSLDFEFVRGSKSSLAQQILDYAEQLKEQNTVNFTSNGKLSVLLDTHFKDHFYALGLRKTLIENQIRPFIIPQEDDPRENINLLRDRISQVRKLIFIYGRVSEEWLLARISAALQLIITNKYNIEDFIIYMVPPHKEYGSISLNQRIVNMNVIDSSNNEIAEKSTLDKFIMYLKTGSV